jgi:hypothetical protein
MIESESIRRWHFFLNICIACVWFINGFCCKLLNLVPRHQQIVAHILGADHASILTRTIGVLEVFMAIWVISRIHSRLCTFVQIALVATMNIIEYNLALDLLLFGRMNILVASVFILIVIVNESLYQRTKIIS